MEGKKRIILILNSDIYQEFAKTEYRRSCVSDSESLRGLIRDCIQRERKSQVKNPNI